MMNVIGSAHGESRISRGRLDKYFFKGRLVKNFSIGNAVERHAARESFMEAIAWPSARLNQGRQALLVWSERPATTQEPENSAEHQADDTLPGEKKSTESPRKPAAASPPPAAPGSGGSPLAP